MISNKTRWIIIIPSVLALGAIVQIVSFYLAGILFNGMGSDINSYIVFSKYMSVVLIAASSIVAVYAISPSFKMAASTVTSMIILVWAILVSSGNFAMLMLATVSIALSLIAVSFTHRRAWS